MSSSAEHDLYKRANGELGRALRAWWRGLWRRREPRIEEAQVLAFPADRKHSKRAAERSGSEAA